MHPKKPYIDFGPLNAALIKIGDEVRRSLLRASCARKGISYGTAPTLGPATDI